MRRSGSARRYLNPLFTVIPGLVPGTYEHGGMGLAALAPSHSFHAPRSWVPGTRPGMTIVGESDLRNRVTQHREGSIPGFTQRYGVKRLLWCEFHDGIAEAIQRETSLKRYRRDWKINLIEAENPNWDDLSRNCSSRQVRWPICSRVRSRGRPPQGLWPSTNAEA
jgi:putative endonuclease